MSVGSRTGGSLARFLSGDRDQAWSDFLAAQAPLILQVVRLFERDADSVQDCFLFVCERLRRDDLRRIRRFREDGAASFATWLRAVTRRLCLDWRRHRFGRFRLPRAVARLPELDQEVFRCLHLRRQTENEALHCLRTLWPALTRAQLGEAAARVASSLQGRQPWFLLVRRPRVESFSDASPRDDSSSGEGAGVDPADPRADPERDAADHERELALGLAIEQLPPRARLLLRLRFVEELGLEQIARLAGLSGATQVERELQRAIVLLRSAMGVGDPDDVSVKAR